MAANEYYSSFNSNNRREDHDLPALPSQTPTSYDNTSKPNNFGAQQHQHGVSPVSSPFDDSSYPTTYRPHDDSQTNLTNAAAQDYSYHGAGGQAYAHPNSSDPFADQNAIPLQSNNSNTKHNNAAVYEDGYDPEQPGRPNKRHGSRRSRKKKVKITWVVWILTAVQVGVFIGELIKNGTCRGKAFFQEVVLTLQIAMLTKSPIEIHPSFNFMIGPSPWVLINMGARYQPCMHNVRNITDSSTTISWLCPNATSYDDYNCSLSEACGMGGVPDQPAGTNFRDRSHEPNQWWRFIVPIFLHAGIIHIGFNMALQLTLGRDMEKLIGPIRFALVYFSSGIFGFVLGGNYAAPLIASTGASGALFGILALHLLDLLYNWTTRRSPMKDLLFLLLDVAIAFVLGLLPGLDNFSHIGGFIMGIVLGVCLMHSPAALRKRTGEDDPPYSAVAPGTNAAGEPAGKTFVKQPIGFFKGRKPFWWAWWGARAAALAVTLIGFILLLNNFYVTRNTCSWCHHLTCLVSFLIS